MADDSSPGTGLQPRFSDLLPSAQAAPGSRFGGRSVPAGRVAFWIVGLYLLCCLFFPGPGGDWYQESRLDVTLALVNHATLSIDAYHRDTEDKAYYGGHYYSITAPGLSFVGVPVAWLYERAAGTKGLEDVGPSGHTSYQFFMLRYLETIVTVAVPAALLLLVFFWFLGFLTGSLFIRSALTLALGLATGLFPYGQVYVAHAPAAALLFTAFGLLYALAGPGRRASLPGVLRGHPALTAATAGFMLGLAILVEYQTAVAVAVLGVYMAVRQPRLLASVVGGAIPAVCVVLLCNQLMYHSLLSTGYGAHSVLWHSQFGNGIAGISWPPKGAALLGMSVSPFRGLLFLSPFLVLSIAGLWTWFRREAAEAAVCLVLPTAYFLMIAMIPFWQAGISVGPRYLLPSVPFLCAPIALALDRARLARVLFFALAALSLFNVWAQTLGGTGFPRQLYTNPLFQYSLPAILHGTIRASLGTPAVAPFGNPYSPAALLVLAALALGWSAFALRPGVWRRACSRPAVAEVMAPQ